MGQIIKPLASVTPVCPPSYGRNSQSILMKLCSVVRNPKSKIEFVTGQNATLLPLFPPSFHPRDAFSMARSEHHSNADCGYIVAFDSSKDASRRPLHRQS